MSTQLHTWTWLTWLAAALIAISVTRNLIYLTLILVCLLVVFLFIEDANQRGAYPFSLLRFGIIVSLLSMLFNLLISHFGETVFLTLPEKWPLIGGPYTLEALVYGLTNGLVLFGILIAFTDLNQAMPVRMLIRLIPRAFFPVAVVISIAVTFVPTTIRQFYQIKEAQMLRGQRMKSLRDWLPLVMPLLVGGLERALQLSEAMTARGFASTAPKSGNTIPRLAMIVSILEVMTGWVVSTRPGWEALGLGLILAGLLALLGALWWAGRQVPRTNYLKEEWRLADGVVLTGILVLGLALFFPFEWIDRSSLYYSVYPLLQLPDFDPWIGTALLGLGLPAYVIGLRKR